MTLLLQRHPGDNPFYSTIDSMPDIRPRRKSIPLVSELVSQRESYSCCFLSSFLPLYNIGEPFKEQFPFEYSTIQHAFVSLCVYFSLRKKLETGKVSSYVFFEGKNGCNKSCLFSKCLPLPRLGVCEPRLKSSVIVISYPGAKQLERESLLVGGSLVIFV